MEVLQQAYDARAKKLNKIEKIKEQRTGEEAYSQLERYAKEGYASIPAEDKSYFLKCFGIYDRPATPERFMIKMRIPGGHLNASQARMIGACAKEYGQDY
ncbi:MAG: ferredoxin--nitrite reductase, partial [Sulfurimonas sp.]|nr:ferredoxin--nitrite reductase [Sulfurimonas sp.]